MMHTRTATHPSAIPPDHTPGVPGLWLPALLWNGLFGTVAVLAVQGRLDTPTPALEWGLVGLAALGPLLLLGAGVETFRALRFRGLRLEPDPPVASPGGEVGGTVVVPVPTGRDAGAFRMVLHCVRRDSQGETVRDRVLWSREFEPRVSPGHRSTRLSFAVPLDPSLPPGDDEPAGIRWLLGVTGAVPGLDLDASFTLPVRPEAAPAPSGIPVLPEAPPAPRDLDLHGVSVRRDAGALLFHFGAGRTAGMGVAFGIFGAVFLGSAAFMAVTTGLTTPAWDGPFEWALGLVSGGFVLVFGAVGLLLLALGVWLATNRLRVEVRPDRIRTRRRVLWFVPAGGAEVMVSSVERLEASITSQVGQGGSASVGYRMVACTPSGRFTVGDGIRGPGLLHELGRLVERETGLELEVPAGPTRPRRPSTRRESG